MIRKNTLYRLNIKRLFIILFFLFNSLPAMSMDSREMEEIIRNITGSKTQIDNFNQVQSKRSIPAEITQKNETEKDENAAFSSPSPDEALLKNGIQLFEASLYESSKKSFDELIAKYPDSPFRDNASVWLAKISLKLNKLKEADDILDSIGQESGEYPSALFLQADIRMRQGNSAGTIEYFFRVNSLFPDHELADDTLISIGNLYLKDNKGSQALESAIRIIKNYKDRETVDDAYFLIAQIFEKDALLKDFSIARKIYQIFLKKAGTDNVAAFRNSPLIEKVELNLKNIEAKYYSKAFIN